MSDMTMHGHDDAARRRHGFGGARDLPLGGRDLRADLRPLQHVRQGRRPLHAGRSAPRSRPAAAPREARRRALPSAARFCARRHAPRVRDVTPVRVQRPSTTCGFTHADAAGSTPWVVAPARS